MLGWKEMKQWRKVASATRKTRKIWVRMRIWEFDDKQSMRRHWGGRGRKETDEMKEQRQAWMDGMLTEQRTGQHVVKVEAQTGWSEAGVLAVSWVMAGLMDGCLPRLLSNGTKAGTTQWSCSAFSQINLYIYTLGTRVRPGVDFVSWLKSSWLWKLNSCLRVKVQRLKSGDCSHQAGSKQGPSRVHGHFSEAHQQTQDFSLPFVSEYNLVYASLRSPSGFEWVAGLWSIWRGHVCSPTRPQTLNTTARNTISTDQSDGNNKEHLCLLIPPSNSGDERLVTFN